MSAETPITPDVVIADASRVDPVTFWKTIHADRYAQREADKARADDLRAAIEAGDINKHADLMLQAIARSLGMPFDELDRRTRDQWL